MTHSRSPMSERYQKVLRLGIRFNGSTFELLDGRPLPKLAQNCVGELLLPPHSILDVKERDEFQREERLPFLAKDTEVYLGMSPGAIEGSFPNGLVRSEEIHLQSGYLLVKVVLLQNLLLRYRGDQKAWLDDCECKIPVLEKSLERPAASLNHAFTLASTHYEKKRRQHNANVFNRAWTHIGGRWQRLDELRNSAIETHLAAQVKKSTG